MFHEVPVVVLTCSTLACAAVIIGCTQLRGEDEVVAGDG
jgi:hypothetical protein